ncbi:MAG: type II secretion system GspH family protein [Pseudomonadota bacterium]|nr:type II secretion system GspH family protein [Pseudomonadota bacterium]
MTIKIAQVKRFGLKAKFVLGEFDEVCCHLLVLFDCDSSRYRSDYHDSKEVVSKSSQNAFTLIEMVIAIDIIGILAALSLPRYIDLSNESKLASVQSVAAGLSSASAINYSSRKLNGGYGIPITKCEDSAGTLLSGLPSGYTIRSQIVAVDQTASCLLNLGGSLTSNGTVATFTAIGIL